MQNRFGWVSYTNRVKRKSFFMSLLLHSFLFFLFFTSLFSKKEEKFEKEIFIVKMIDFSQLEPVLQKEEKTEKILLPSVMKENIKKSEEKKIVDNEKKRYSDERKGFTTETFSTEDYKKKLYSKILKEKESGDSVSNDFVKNIDIKIPELKTTEIGSRKFTVTSEIPDWYINMIKKEIQRNWILSEYLIDFSAIVSFRIYRDGKIENIIIEKSSGYKNFDNSIVEAIKTVKKWPAFPKEIKDAYLDIIIEFKTEG